MAGLAWTKGLAWLRQLRAATGGLSGGGHQYATAASVKSPPPQSNDAAEDLCPPRILNLPLEKPDFFRLSELVSMKELYDA